MIFINPQGEYPRYIGDLQIDHPSWVEGDALPSGWTEVTPTELPTPSDTQRVVEVYPVEEGGVWVQAWELIDLTEEEIARKNAPITVKAKLLSLGFTEIEATYLLRGLR